MDSIQRYLDNLLSNEEIKWWIKFRKPSDIAEHHPTFLYCEVLHYITAFLTFVHALRHGGRYKWLWLAAIFHGLTVEYVSYAVPDINNFWHAQAMVMLLGQRLPLHIILLYPSFIYTASVAVSQMKLRWWAEPFAVGIAVVLLDVPFDIMGIKLLWWTWHDDDPNIFDRHYMVPWSSYYFHAAFASAFTFIFHGIRNLLCRNVSKFESAGFFSELVCALITGLFSMLLGVLQFVPIYHPLHDSLNIHTEVCVLLLIAIYVMIVWSSDRKPYLNARSDGVSKSSILEIILIILIHYTSYIYLVINSQPQNNRSTGWHQTVGSCQETVPVQTLSGQVLSKRKNLCLKDYEEESFDFHCVKEVPQDGSAWYTICGTQFPNHTEYIIVVSAFCVFGLFFYYQAMFRSGHLSSAKPIKRKYHRD